MAVWPTPCPMGFYHQLPTVTTVLSPVVSQLSLHPTFSKDSLAEELGINTRQMADVLIRFLEEFESSQRAA